MLTSRFLIQSLVLDNQIKQLTSLHKLHHQVQVLLGLYDLVDLNHVRVMQLLEDLDLTTYALDILLISNPALFKHFDSDL